MTPTPSDGAITAEAICNAPFPNECCEHPEQCASIHGRNDAARIHTVVADWLASTGDIADEEQAARMLVRDLTAARFEIVSHDILEGIATRALAAEARAAELAAVGTKILAKLDSPTASVTQWDADELRAALLTPPQREASSGKEGER